MSIVLQGWVEGAQKKLAPTGTLRGRFVLAASVVCAWFLGKEGFGELGMIQSTAGMFWNFAGLGLGITATKYVSELRRLQPARTGWILALSASAAFKRARCQSSAKVTGIFMRAS